MLKQVRTVPVSKTSFEYKIKALIYLVMPFEIFFRYARSTKDLNFIFRKVIQVTFTIPKINNNFFLPFSSINPLWNDGEFYNSKNDLEFEFEILPHCIKFL